VLSDRLRGAQAVALRGRDVPHAYRVFFRHVGLEPDETRIPVEALVVERLRLGGFPSRGRLPDALAIACVETGVPVWALDADALDGPPGVRPATARDAPVPQGRLVLADASRALAVLFEAPEGPTRETRRLALISVVVPHVPALFAEEALWIAGEALEA
jgi:DNA/RNA-binding domain of Phe-tRNA-synthetase-like protein